MIAFIAQPGLNTNRSRQQSNNLGNIASSEQWRNPLDLGEGRSRRDLNQVLNTENRL